jgi:spore coat protein U-like protein
MLPRFVIQLWFRRFMRNLLTALLTAGALLGAAASASAATATNTFTVTATVNATCKVSAANLTFNYTPGGGNVANNTAVTVNCTSGQHRRAAPAE